MKTPVYLQLDSLVNNLDTWVVEPTSVQDLEGIEALMSNDRFYYKIYSPNVDNSNSTITSRSTTVSFAPHPNYRSAIRIEMTPTVGYGKNSCYKVELWKWNKVFSRIPIPSKITKKRILTEYWLVPNTDGVYFTDYEDLRSTKLRYLSYDSRSGFYDFSNPLTVDTQTFYISYENNSYSKIKRLQINVPPDSPLYTGYLPPNTLSLPNLIDAVGVFRVTDWQGNLYYPGEDFIIKDDVCTWTPPLPTSNPTPVILSPTYQIEWLVPSPVCYRLEYPLPLSRADLIYRLDQPAVLTDPHYQHVYRRFPL